MGRLTNKKDRECIKQSGFIAARAMKKVLESVRVGVTLKELDQIAEKEILDLGGECAFKSVPGYFWTTCLSLNNELVHGIPRDIVLKKGDRLGVDLGAGFKGWYTDTAWSVIVGEEKGNKFLEDTERAMWEGIKMAVVGNRVGDISAAIQGVMEEENDYFVSRTLIGHGVGKKLHEDPEIPGYGERGKGPKLLDGMALAIEVIANERRSRSWVEEDGWTINSDSLGSMFEMTVVVGRDKPEVLTDWRKVS